LYRLRGFGRIFFAGGCNHDLLTGHHSRRSEQSCAIDRAVRGRPSGYSVLRVLHVRSELQNALTQYRAIAQRKCVYVRMKFPLAKVPGHSRVSGAVVVDLTETLGGKRKELTKNCGRD
jgi:hypothetical protein